MDVLMFVLSLNPNKILAFFLNKYIYFKIYFIYWCLFLPKIQTKYFFLETHI